MIILILLLVFLLADIVIGIPALYWIREVNSADKKAYEVGMDGCRPEPASPRPVFDQSGQMATAGLAGSSYDYSVYAQMLANQQAAIQGMSYQQMTGMYGQQQCQTQTTYDDLLRMMGGDT